MAAPLAQDDIIIKIKDELVSLPYVLMTINLMKKFGVHVENQDNRIFKVKPTTYLSPNQVFIEGLLFYVFLIILIYF